MAAALAPTLPRPSVPDGAACARDVRARGHGALESSVLEGGELALAAGDLALWDDLPPDPYWRAEWGRRERRHGAFDWVPSAGDPRPLPGLPHLQARAHNHLYGGVERRLPALPEGFLAQPGVARWLAWWRAMLLALDGPGGAYRVELHAFRVRPGADGTPGRPTPEGLHRDGHDWVAVHLLAREGLDGGRLTLVDDRHGVQRRLPVGEVPSAVWLDDRRMRHVAEPVRATGDPERARRDTLVATFRRLDRG